LEWFSSWVDWDWEHESYPRYEDFAFLPLFAFCFPAVRFILDRFVFEKLGWRLMNGSKNKQASNDNDEESQKRRMRKFKESAWKCVYYLLAEMFALAVTYNEPWFKSTRYFWVGPGDQLWPEQRCK
ncbi:hypothetical protein M569_04592, partial [Genlisea aurea]